MERIRGRGINAFAMPGDRCELRAALACQQRRTLQADCQSLPRSIMLGKLVYVRPGALVATSRLSTSGGEDSNKRRHVGHGDFALYMNHA
jgi:hypothetical protein